MKTTQEKLQYIKGKTVILGHPITLGHILRTIDYYEGGNYVIDCHGCFMKRVYLSEGYISNGCSQWNLTKDNLNDQSEATIDFLYQIIK